MSNYLIKKIYLIYNYYHQASINIFKHKCIIEPNRNNVLFHQYLSMYKYIHRTLQTICKLMLLKCLCFFFLLKRVSI